MRKSKLLALAITGFCAALTFAQTLPPMFPAQHNKSGGIIRVDHSQGVMVTREFSLNGKRYMSIVVWLRSDPPLDMSSPLILTPAKAEETARKELRKLGGDDWGWRVTDFGISRYPDTDAWYYTLTLKEAVIDGVPSDVVTVLFDSAGEAGRILPSG